MKVRNIEMGLLLKIILLVIAVSFIFVLEYKKKMDMSMDLNLIKTFFSINPSYCMGINIVCGYCSCKHSRS